VGDRQSRLDIYPKWRDPLPFAYESTGIETRLINNLHPSPTSRVFAFHRAETLIDERDKNEQLIWPLLLLYTVLIGRSRCWAGSRYKFQRRRSHSTFPVCQWGFWPLPHLHPEHQYPLQPATAPNAQTRQYRRRFRQRHCDRGIARHRAVNHIERRISARDRCGTSTAVRLQNVTIDPERAFSQTIQID
jgi:hypothetical protein